MALFLLSEVEVYEASVTALGAFAETLGIPGVIILPIASGDTASRSARMIIADYLNIAQRKIGARLWIAIPMSIISSVLTQIDSSLLW
ncbi:hypothetical protein [Indiicoccus explosivorum]|uniref:hypothetical protein n=1 Tax=Indiicoccus explosivorum TaxID=1917864 RepID=UPI000B4325BE|nr:hypothetical protein [Indiicoccus explosivorum]